MSNNFFKREFIKIKGLLIINLIRAGDPIGNGGSL